MMRPQRRVSRLVRSGADRACDLPVVVVELENSLTASGGVRRRVDQSGLRARHVDRVHAVVAVAAGRELMEIGVHAVRAIGPAQGAGYWMSSIGAIARTRGRVAVRVPIDGLVVLCIGHQSGLPRWGALSRRGCRCHGLGPCAACWRGRACECGQTAQPSRRRGRSRRGQLGQHDGCSASRWASRASDPAARGHRWHGVVLKRRGDLAAV